MFDERESPKVALFLQGPPSQFWPELANAMVLAGWDVKKINLATSDALFWRGAVDHSFSGSVESWETFLSEFVQKHGVTHILGYADRQPYHRVAARVGQRHGARFFVIENGYLRPDWITCEEGGMGAFSHMSKDPEALSVAARDLEPVDLEVRYTHPFFSEACREVAFHLSNGLTPRFLWRFDHDRYYHPIREYLAWLRRLPFEGMSRRHAERVAAKLLFKERPYYFAPLQLQSDYSIRDGSPFGHLSEFIGKVTESFARNAPGGHHLLFKVHPHDNGLERWGRVVAKAASANGVRQRVHIVAGGPFGSFVASSRGVIVVNSTSGLHAIRAHRPTIALGGAVYDVPGLTHQGGLDSFWRSPEPIDSALLRDFIKVLAAQTQIKGSFFCPDGRQKACEGVIDRLSRASAAAPVYSRSIAEGVDEDSILQIDGLMPGSTYATA